MNPIMHIEMEMGGEIVIELFPDTAKNTVRSVIALANEGLYNDRIFYRVVKDFVLQTDCDKRPGIFETGCDYVIEGEYAANDYLVPQPLFGKYMVGMAGDGKHISGGSAFFIQTGPCERLNGCFTVIGKVIDGFDVVDQINETPCEKKLYQETIPFHTPISPQRMKRVWVDTKGIPYEKPITKVPSEEYIGEERELDKIIEF